MAARKTPSKTAAKTDVVSVTLVLASGNKVLLQECSGPCYPLITSQPPAKTLSPLQLMKKLLGLELFTV